MHVLGDRDVVLASTDLEHASSFANDWAIDGNPNRLDEEMFTEDQRQDAFSFGRPSRWRSKMLPHVALCRACIAKLDVVLEKKPLRGGHRSFGFMNVGTLC